MRPRTDVGITPDEQERSVVRWQLEAGTDGATVALFDAAGLPADFAEIVQADPIQLFNQLQAEGRLFWSDTGGDGSYLAELTIGGTDDPPPDALVDPVVSISPFHVPSGRLWFAGAEYVFPDPRAGVDGAGLARHPHMGGSVDIVAGSYHLLAWLPEVDEGKRASEVAAAVLRVRTERHLTAPATAGIGIFIAILGTAFVWASGLRGLHLSILLPAWAFAGWLTVSAWRAERAVVGPARLGAERAFPSFRFHLTPLSGSGRSGPAS